MAEVKVPRDVSPEGFLDMVRCGVFDAVREIMTSSTTNPSAAFYGAIRDGVEAATKALVTAKQLRPDLVVVPDSAPS